MVILSGGGSSVLPLRYLAAGLAPYTGRGSQAMWLGQSGATQSDPLSQ